MYFVKLTEEYTIPHSPQILRFLLSFPIEYPQKTLWLKLNSTNFFIPLDDHCRISVTHSEIYSNYFHSYLRILDLESVNFLQKNNLL